MAVTYVDYSNDVLGAMLNDPVDCRDDVAGVARPVRLQHLQADDVGAGSDAGIVAVIRTGDDARDVGAVAELVGRRAVLRREIHAGHDLLAARLVIGDPGVDDRHAYAPAGIALEPRDGPAPDLIRSNRLRGDRHQPPHGDVAGKVVDVRVLTHRLQSIARKLDDGGAAKLFGDPPAVPLRDGLD